jgi:hypothetical protein
VEWLAPTPEPGPQPDRDDVAARLAALEARLERVETAVRNANDDLRHTVAELGRLLVRDLGKLNKLLERHRDAIIDELRPPAAPASPGGAEPEPDPTGVGALEAQLGPQGLEHE